MKMSSLVPISWEKWLVKTAVNLIRSSRVLGRDNYYSVENDGYLNYTEEMKASYDLVTENVWFYASCYSIGSSLSSLPFGVYKRKNLQAKDYELEEDHWLTLLLNNPNPDYTGEELIEGTAWSLELSGVGYWEKVRNKAGRVVELWLLDPRAVKPVPGTNGRLYERFDVDVNGQIEKFSPKDIVVFKYHNPRSNYMGLSAATPAGVPITVDVKSDTFNKNFFANHAIPPYVFENEDKNSKAMKEDELKALVKEWSKLFRGEKNAHRVGVTWGGWKLKEIQTSQKDMEFNKTKEDSRTRILASFGVPPSCIGLLQGQNKATAKEEKKVYWEITIKPKSKVICRGIYKHLLVAEELNNNSKRQIRADFSGVAAIQEDLEIRARTAFNAVKSTHTLDEARKDFYGKDELKPDRNKPGSRIYIPNNMIPLDRIDEFWDNYFKDAEAKRNSSKNKPGKPEGPSAGGEGSDGEDTTADKPSNKPKK